jgi:fluoride exporter
MVAVVSKEIFQGKRILAVLCGGFLGTLARALLSLWIQSFMGNGWPYDILTINITGAFVLALLSTLADASLFINPMRRLFFNVGFIGAYTTFSSMALGDVTLVSGSQQFLALLYIVCSLAGGVIAVLFGQFCGIRIIDVARHQHVRTVSGAQQAIGLAEEKNEILGREASEQSLQEEEKMY